VTFKLFNCTQQLQVLIIQRVVDATLLVDLLVEFVVDDLLLFALLPDFFNRLRQLTNLIFNFALLRLKAFYAFALLGKLILNLALFSLEVVNCFSQLFQFIFLPANLRIVFV
jgi:hypothetical protein